MKRHFEYVPLSLSLAVNSIIGILLLPAACAASCCIFGRMFTSPTDKERICGAVILAASAGLALCANRLVYLFMKRHTKPDITVSEKAADLCAVLSAAAASIPSAALLIFGAVHENTIGAVCLNIGIFVFALTLYYSQRTEPIKRNR